MKNFIFTTAASTVLVFVSLAGTAQADFYIALTDNGTGGTAITLNGTGTTGNGTATTISFGTLGDTFVNDGDSFIGTTNPNFLLGGVPGEGINNANLNFGVRDLDNVGGINSAITFIFESAIPNGSNLSDLNGIYDAPFVPFADLNLGDYRIVQSETGGAFLDVGSVTIRVGAIPEPGSAALLGLFGLCGLVRRRRQVV